MNENQKKQQTAENRQGEMDKSTIIMEGINTLLPLSVTYRISRKKNQQGYRRFK